MPETLNRIDDGSNNDQVDLNLQGQDFEEDGRDKPIHGDGVAIIISGPEPNDDEMSESEPEEVTEESENTSQEVSTSAVGQGNAPLTKAKL